MRTHWEMLCFGHMRTHYEKHETIFVRVCWHQQLYYFLFFWWHSWCLIAYSYSCICVITSSFTTWNNFSTFWNGSGWLTFDGVSMERFLELLIILKCLNLWNIQNRAENLKFLKHNALIFDYICCASSELYHIFSVPVLILLTTKFVSVVTAAFIYIYYLIHSNSVLENYSLLFPFLFFTEWIQMLILLTSADMPVNQVILLNTPHHFKSYL